MDLRNAMDQFQALEDYLDSMEQVKACEKGIEELREAEQGSQPDRGGAEPGSDA